MLLNSCHFCVASPAVTVLKFVLLKEHVATHVYTAIFQNLCKYCCSVNIRLFLE